MKNKVYSIKILSIFILLVFAFNLISAIETNLINKAGTYVYELTNGIPDTAKTGFAKLLLVTLVIILVYAAAGFIPLISDSGGIQWVVAIIVGLLSFLFVSPENIQFILANYEALGIALTTIVPLVILIAFTIKIETDERYGMWGTFINRFFIALFIIYAVGRWFTISWDASKSMPELAWMYPLALIVALIWFFAIKPVGKIVRAAKKGKKAERARDITEAGTEEIINQARAHKRKADASEDIIVKNPRNKKGIWVKD